MSADDFHDRDGDCPGAVPADLLAIYVAADEDPRPTETVLAEFKEVFGAEDDP